MSEYLTNTIRKFKGFTELYADSGDNSDPMPPRIRERVKFKLATEQFTDDDLRAIREYDRAKYGGFVNG